MTRAYIVRHGNTFGADEPPRRIGARTDLALTQAGIDQALRLGDHFASQRLLFGAILTGPLMRTRQTADHLLNIVQPGAVAARRTASWLNEIDHGPDEGRLETEVVGRLGQPALDTWARQAIAPGDWKVDAEGRIAAWQRFFACLTVDTLIVTSNGAARFALLAGSCPAPSGGFHLRTGSYGLIAKRTGNAMTLVDWDRRP